MFLQKQKFFLSTNLLLRRSKMIKHIQLWQFFLVLLVPATATAPKDVEKAALQQLSLLLGLPVNDNVAPPKREDFPSFINGVYNCWTNDPDDDCLPGYHGKDVNLVRTFLGSEDTSPSTALLAYNTARMLNNSMEISFNISISTRQVDTVRYAMLRLYRRSLTTSEIEMVKSKCGSDFDLPNVTLQLYTQSGTIGNLSTFSLKAVRSLSGSELVDEEWVEFMNLTRVYKDFVDSTHSSAPRNITLRLAVRAPCSSITPTELGFVFATSTQKPQLVEFAENSLQKEMMFSQVLGLLTPIDFRSRLSKRQVLNAPVSNNSSDDDVLDTLPVNYKSINCKLYHFQVVLSTLNLTKIIVHPTTYNANICAGRCGTFPTSNLANHHAFLQALASIYYPNEVPPPCCVPKPGTLVSVAALVPGEQEEYATRIYKDMIATECTCL